MSDEKRARELLDRLNVEFENEISGIDYGKAKRLFKRGKKSFSYGDYGKSISYLEDALENINKKLDEYRQLTLTLEKTHEKISYVKKKNGNYKRWGRAYHKAKSALEENDLKRCNYFIKKALEGIDEEYNRLYEPEKQIFEKEYEEEMLEEQSAEKITDEEEEEEGVIDISKVDMNSIWDDDDDDTRMQEEGEEEGGAIGQVIQEGEETEEKSEPVIEEDVIEIDGDKGEIVEEDRKTDEDKSKIAVVFEDDEDDKEEEREEDRPEEKDKYHHEGMTADGPGPDIVMEEEGSYGEEIHLPEEENEGIDHYDDSTGEGNEEEEEDEEKPQIIITEEVIEPEQEQMGDQSIHIDNDQQEYFSEDSDEVELDKSEQTSAEDNADMLTEEDEYQVQGNDKQDSDSHHDDEMESMHSDELFPGEEFQGFSVDPDMNNIAETYHEDIIMDEKGEESPKEAFEMDEKRSDVPNDEMEELYYDESSVMYETDEPQQEMKDEFHFEEEVVGDEEMPPPPEITDDNKTPYEDKEEFSSSEKPFDMGHSNADWGSGEDEEEDTFEISTEDSVEFDSKDTPDTDWQENGEDEVPEEVPESGIRIGKDTEDELQQKVTEMNQSLAELPPGIDLKEVIYWIDKGERDLQRKDYNNSKRALDKSKRLLNEISEEYERAKQQINETEEKIKRANELDLDVKRLLPVINDAKSKLDDGKLEEVNTICNDVLSDVQDILDEQESRVEMLSLKDKILKYKEEGIDIKSAAEVFNTAGMLMKEKKFHQVRELASKSDQLAELSRSKHIADITIEETEDSLGKLEEYDIEVSDLEKQLGEIQELLGLEKYEEALSMSEELKTRLMERVEPILNDEMHKLKHLVEDNEVYLDVSEEKDEMEIAEKKVQLGQVVEALNHIVKAQKSIENNRENGYPLVNLEFGEENLIENVWNRAKIVVKNTGKVHAKNISMNIVGPVEVRRLGTIPSLNSKEVKEIEIAVKFDGGGSVPVDVEINYKSKLDDETHESKDGLWVEVGSKASPGKENDKRGGSTDKKKKNSLVQPRKATRCKICLGVIKQSSIVYECGCGREYHESCIERVGTCPSCGLDFQD